MLHYAIKVARIMLHFKFDASHEIRMLLRGHFTFCFIQTAVVTYIVFFLFAVFCKGLRLGLDVFLVTTHEDACKEEVRLDVLFAQARVQWDNKPVETGLKHDYNMTFLISNHEC